MSEYPDTWRHQRVLNDCIGEKAKIKLLILDVDGVLTDGTKVYTQKHEPVYKRFRCKDFTAIKRFVAAGVKVIMLSGDNWNADMARQRNIPFYCTRGKDLSLDKSVYLSHLEGQYDVKRENMAFVGDDFFDLSMFKTLFWTFAPSDAPKIIRQNCLYRTLNRVAVRESFKNCMISLSVKVSYKMQLKKQLQSWISKKHLVQQ